MFCVEGFVARLPLSGPSAEEWETLHFRNNQVILDSLFETQSKRKVNQPETEIVRRLKSYDNPSSPPVITLTKNPMPVMPNLLSVDETALKEIVEPLISRMQEYAK